jgi:hypothetical protein
VTLHSPLLRAVTRCALVVPQLPPFSYTYLKHAIGGRNGLGCAGTDRERTWGRGVALARAKRGAGGDK